MSKQDNPQTGLNNTIQLEENRILQTKIMLAKFGIDERVLTQHHLNLTGMILSIYDKPSSRKHSVASIYLLAVDASTGDLVALQKADTLTPATDFTLQLKKFTAEMEHQQNALPDGSVSDSLILTFKGLTNRRKPTNITIETFSNVHSTAEMYESEGFVHPHWVIQNTENGGILGIRLSGYEDSERTYGMNRTFQDAATSIAVILTPSSYDAMPLAA